MEEGQGDSLSLLGIGFRSMSRAAIGFRSMRRSRDGESLIMLLDKVGRVSHDAGGPAHPGDLNILCLETQANAGGEQAGRWRVHWPEVRGGVVARPRTHLLETIVYPTCSPLAADEHRDRPSGCRIHLAALRTRAAMRSVGAGAASSEDVLVA